MPRFLRYLLIWLSCTAASVTAVIITVHFVVGSTRPTAPVAQSATDFAASPRPSATPRPSPSPSATPSPSNSTRTPTPAPSKPPEKTREPSPTPPARTTAPPEQPTANPDEDCEGGYGVHTVPSEGGRVTVRYGVDRVCLISAVPNQGFTVSTEQDTPETLTVTFAASRHRSEVTATTEPVDQASVRETSF